METGFGIEPKSGLFTRRPTGLKPAAGTSRLSQSKVQAYPTPGIIPSKDSRARLKIPVTRFQLATTPNQVAGKLSDSIFQNPRF